MWSELPNRLAARRIVERGDRNAALTGGRSTGAGWLAASWSPPRG